MVISRDMNLAINRGFRAIDLLKNQGIISALTIAIHHFDDSNDPDFEFVSNNWEYPEEYSEHREKIQMRAVDPFSSVRELKGFGYTSGVKQNYTVQSMGSGWRVRNSGRNP